jgi:hypothetical protein
MKRERERERITVKERKGQSRSATTRQKMIKYVVGILYNECRSGERLILLLLGCESALTSTACFLVKLD